MVAPILRTFAVLAAGSVLFAADDPAQEKKYRLEPGTKIPLKVIKGISSRGTAEGEAVYLQTIFPIVVNGKIVIPVDSHVAGTVTRVKRAGRVKGRAELFVRFDSLILPNGVTRDFRSRMGAVDGTVKEKFDREEGKLEGDTNKGNDARTIGEAAAGGVSAGAIAGSVAGRTAMGAGIGAAAGAAAGVIGVILTRGPDAELARGTSVEMVLDRALEFSEPEVPATTRTVSRTVEEEVPAAKPARRPLPVPGAGRIP